MPAIRWSLSLIYTEKVPSTGSGGCLRVVGTNTGAAGGNLTNFMFYQQVTLERGVAYTFNCAYKDIRTNNYWFEVYVGGMEPAVGSDYRTNEGATFIGGYKSANWAPECTTDEFDGNFLETACSPDGTIPLYWRGRVTQHYFSDSGWEYGMTSPVTSLLRRWSIM